MTNLDSEPRSTYLDPWAILCTHLKDGRGLPSARHSKAAGLKSGAVVRRSGPAEIILGGYFTSNCTDNCSEVPTEFCAWQVYNPASRRPTGRNCSVSCKLAISERPARRQTMLAGGLASATQRRTRASLSSSKSISGEPIRRMLGAYFTSSLASTTTDLAV
uniref:RT09817p n=1 Tax=Drosophila melanogaster TaxID=7227 RepID=E0R961_DROME|nr:RT09817p [Drosophila melanogaster]